MVSLSLKTDFKRKVEEVMELIVVLRYFTMYTFNVKQEVMYNFTHQNQPHYSHFTEY